MDFWNRARYRQAMSEFFHGEALAATAAITGAPVGYSAYQNGGMPDHQAVALSAAPPRGAPSRSPDRTRSARSSPALDVAWRRPR